MDADFWIDRFCLKAEMESAFADGDTEDAYRAGLTMRNLLLARHYAGRFLIENDDASYW